MFACLGGTLLNPYGLELYKTLLAYAADKPEFDMIGEFKAPGFRFTNEWVALALTLLAVFVTGWRRKIEFFPLLLFSTSIYVSFQAVRDIWLVAIVSAWFIAQFDWHRVVQLSPPSRYSRPALAAAIILSSVMVVVVCLGSEEKYRGKVQKAFPVEAVKFIEREGYQGPLLCDYGWGGYLIWQLPQVPVFIDGRAHVHGLEAVKEHYNTLKGTLTWHQNKNLNESEIVLIPRESALASLLRLDPRFRLKYEDEIAVVFENSLQN